MAVEWAGLGPELLVRLDRDGPETLGAQIQRELRDAIRSGRLAAGEKLPSSRTLAVELSVSRGLVQECYGQLEAEGYLVTRGGSATRVAATAATPPPAATAVAPAPRLSVDFRYGVPDLGSFPMRDWMWALSEAGRRAPSAAAGYGDPRGDGGLREVVAAYLRRVRGSAASPEHIVICSGFAQGVNLVLAALAGTGVAVVGVEDPGDRDNDAIVRRAGLRSIQLGIDDQGADVVTLSASAAGAVILTPAHQAPTGVVLGSKRRHALLAWAVRTGGVIIEDDYDAEFRYDRQPVGSLQGLAPDRVATIGSVSKSLAPGIRLGWIACPPWLTEAIAWQKEISDRGSPALDQIALGRLIESGRYDRHLRRMRGVYGARREAVVAALARHAPEVRVTGLAAGFHGVVKLPSTADETDVLTIARERGIGLYGMSHYRSDGATKPPELVIGFGNTSESAIERGIAAVADLLRG